MIMAGYEYRGREPFGNVYFTGIVRDKLGRKMSKQLGNSPDPLDLIEKYGADGMRVAMMLSTSAGNDVMFDEALCEQGRNFANKIWNAYRLVGGWNVDDELPQSDNNRLSVEWFRQVMRRDIERVDEAFRQYRISEAFMMLYKLFWDDFSGWYLEMVKPAYQSPIDADTMAATKHFFDELLRLLHPFMPFVTEEIWQDLAPEAGCESIVVARQPRIVETADARTLARFDLAREVISSVRNIRKQKNIAQKDTLTMKVMADENYPEEYAPVIAKMCNLSSIDRVAEKDPAAAAFIVKTAQYFGRGRPPIRRAGRQGRHRGVDTLFRCVGEANSRRRAAVDRQVQLLDRPRSRGVHRYRRQRLPGKRSGLCAARRERQCGGSVVHDDHIRRHGHSGSAISIDMRTLVEEYVQGYVCDMLSDGSDDPEDPGQIALRRLLDREAELLPGSVVVQNNLGVLFCGYGQYDRALEHFVEAHRQTPDDIYAILNIAYVHRLCGHDEEAVGWYSRLLSSDDPTAAEQARLAINEIGRQAGAENLD